MYLLAGLAMPKESSVPFTSHQRSERNGAYLIQRLCVESLQCLARAGLQRRTAPVRHGMPQKLSYEMLCLCAAQTRNSARKRYAVAQHVCNWVVLRPARALIIVRWQNPTFLPA